MSKSFITPQILAGIVGTLAAFTFPVYFAIKGR